MKKQSKLSEWLEEKLKCGHLSLRQAGVRTGLSHATIGDIRKGVRPNPETIRKLAQGFGGGGALEDHLFTLAGYRTPRPEGENTSEAWAHLTDKISRLSEPQLKIMVRFADFLRKIEGED